MALLAATCVVLTGVAVGHRMSEPSDGVVVQFSNRSWQGEQLVVDKVLDADTGLRPSDRIVAVDGVPVASYAESWSGWPTEDLTYTVSRGEALVDVTISASTFPLARFAATSWPTLLTLAVLWLVSIYVFAHRPTDPGARDLLLLAGLMTLGAIGWLLGAPAASLVVHGPSWWHLIEEVPLALTWSVTAHFLLVVAGQRRWTGPGWYAACLATPLALHAAYLAIALPAADDAREVTGRLVQVSLTASTLLPVACVALLVALFVSAKDQHTRQSLRILLASLGFGAIAWLGIWTLPSFLGWRTLDPAYMSLVFLPAVLALGAAIVRRHLLEIDVMVTRTFIYSVITATVLSAYVGTTWLLHESWGPSNPAGVLVVSGLVAMAVQPISARLGRRLVRRVFGVRSDPFSLVRTLDRVDDYSDPHDALAQITTLLTRSLRLPYAEILLVDGHGERVLGARHGEPGPRPVTLPLWNGAQRIGHLLLEVGSGREPFGPADEILLQTLQRQIGGLAANVLLTQELLRSRDRIVRAREEERRQLHNRLHDGLGASLAAETMQLEAARHLIATDPHRAELTLSKLIDGTKELIADLRGVVYGLRPPALDQIGLAAAIRGRAEEFSLLGPSGARLPIEVVEHGNLDGLPAAVEVAAYWIAVEATHNVVKHARASICRITLSRGAALEVCVDDDGHGLPPSVRSGGGLHSMSERAAELGGSVTLSGSGYGGVRLHALLPITSRVVS